MGNPGWNRQGNPVWPCEGAVLGVQRDPPGHWGCPTAVEMWPWECDCQSLGNGHTGKFHQQGEWGRTTLLIALLKAKNTCLRLKTNSTAARIISFSLLLDKQNQGKPNQMFPSS